MNPDAVEELRDLLPLVIHREATVATAGAHDDRGTVGLVLRREIRRDRRLVGIRVADGEWSLAFPEGNGRVRGFFCYQREKHGCENCEKHGFPNERCEGFGCGDTVRACDEK